MSHLDIFGLELKNLLYCGIFCQHPQIFLKTKFQPNIKIFEFLTKTVLTGYFQLDLQKSNIVFEISIFELVNIQSFIEKQKNFKLGPKKLYLGTFGLQFKKNYYQIFGQHPRICENIKFHPKQKIYILGTKNSLFGTLGWNVQKLLSCLKWAHRQICLIAKLRKKKKQKWLHLGPKMPYLTIFGLEFRKTIVTFEISNLELCNCKISQKNKNS